MLEGLHGLLEVYISMGRVDDALELACDPRLEYDIQGRVRVLIATGRIEDAVALQKKIKAFCCEKPAPYAMVIQRRNTKSPGPREM